MSSVITNLKDARELIVKYGWAQRRYGNKECGYCAIGAVCDAVNVAFSADVNATETALRQTLKEWGHEGCVESYNDTDGRTKEEVLDLFDQTIKRLAEGE